MLSSTRQENTTGFSVIELLVTFALLTVVMTISTGSVLSMVSANQKAQALSTSMDSLNFALESISREIRFGNSFDCSAVPVSGNINECSGGDTLGLVSSDGRFIVYSFNSLNGRLERQIDGSARVAMTSPSVTLDNFAFYVRGYLTGGQPRVTMTVTGRAGVKAKIETEFSIQTTVTKRF